MELMHPSKVQLICDETIWTITQYKGQPIEKTTKHDFIKENGGKWVELERIYHLACVANEIIRFHDRLVKTISDILLVLIILKDSYQTEKKF